MLLIILPSSHPMASSNLPPKNIDPGEQTSAILAILPGQSTVSGIRMALRNNVEDPLVLVEASREPLDRPEDIPYLEKDVTELEDYRRNEGRKLSRAHQAAIFEFLTTRKRNLAKARAAANDTTDKIHPVPRDPAPKKWLGRFLGEK